MAEAEVAEFKKGRERSPTFPFISLRAALQRAQEFYAHERRGSAPYGVAAQHWNYSPASSGALQTVSALKQYGLMADEGSGQGRKVKLTELALRILLDSRDDATEKVQYMRQAARAPAIVAEIYERWPDGLPSDATLNHYLVLDRQFNDHTAAKTVRIIKENYEFTGEAADAMLSGLSDSGEDSVSARDLPALTERSRIDAADAGIISTRPGRPTEGSSSVKVERVSAKGIEIELRFSSEPSADMFQRLKKYIEWRIEDFETAPPQQGS